VRTWTLATAVAAFLLMAGTASAASTGGLTSPSVAWSSSYLATISMTATVSYDCAGQVYCGWFAEVYVVDAVSSCSTPGRISWVGPLTEQPTASYTVSYSVFTTAARPETACLYIYAGQHVNLAQVTYAIPAPLGTTTTTPAATPSTPGGASSGAVPPLTIAEGRASVAGVLREKFGGQFTARRGLKRKCYRLLTSTVRCRVRWDHGLWRYSGAVDMKNDPDDPENSILYRTTVRRTRLHASPSGSAPSRPAPTTPAPTNPTPAPSPSCDPSYKRACLKPNVSDYDCAGGSGNGPYYVQGPITVVGDDHYDLDRDGDGIACES
jgi:hypothetical protein